MSDATPALDPDALLVLACPVCQGHVAATATLCGQAACCPLCASLFLVPHQAPLSAPPPTPERAGVAEDWEAVIAKLASPQPSPQPELAITVIEPPPPEPDPAPPSEAPAPPLVEPAPPQVGADAALASRPAAAADAPFPPEAFPACAVPQAADAPTDEPPIPAEAAAAAAPGPDGSPAEPADRAFPSFTGVPLDPRADELAFKEPVRTVQRGRTVIELRRLSPEERRSRRFRRNLMMIVVGVSILLVIVILFGFPAERR